MAYYFYLDKVLLPVPPESLEIKIKNQNKTLVLINEGEINMLKQAGLTEAEFTCLIPQVEYPFALYKDGYQRASYYLDKFEELKSNKEPFQFIVTRTLPDGQMLFDTNLKVSLESYTASESAKLGFDLEVTIKLKQFRDFGTKVAKISSKKATASSTRSTDTSPAPKKTAKTHKVVRGDTLWGLAKKYYGKGTLYTKIYNANKSKIKNPNLIYVGQVFTIPV